LQVFVVTQPKAESLTGKQPTGDDSQSTPLLPSSFSMSVIFKQLRQSANNIYEIARQETAAAAAANGKWRTRKPCPKLATPKKEKPQA